jgi:hypothetical protein
MIRHHAPPPSSPVHKLDRRHTGRLGKRDNLLTGGGGGGGVRGAESYDRRKAWSSINRSVLSGIRIRNADPDPGARKCTKINQKN